MGAFRPTRALHLCANPPTHRCRNTCGICLPTLTLPLARRQSTTEHNHPSVNKGAPSPNCCALPLTPTGGASPASAAHVCPTLGNASITASRHGCPVLRLVTATDLASPHLRPQAHMGPAPSFTEQMPHGSCIAFRQSPPPARTTPLQTTTAWVRVLSPKEAERLSLPFQSECAQLSHMFRRYVESLQTVTCTTAARDRSSLAYIYTKPSSRFIRHLGDVVAMAHDKCGRLCG